MIGLRCTFGVKQYPIIIAFCVLFTWMCAYMETHDPPPLPDRTGSYWDYRGWHHDPNCECITQQKRGEATIKRLHLVGLSKAEVNLRVGRPADAQGERPDLPGHKELCAYDEPEQILVWFDNGICSGEYPNVTIYH